MKRILLLLLIIFLASITFSCQKKVNYEEVGYGENFVTVKEIEYSDKVNVAQVKWADTLTEIIEMVVGDCFTPLSDEILTSIWRQVFLDAKIPEENALSFLNDFQNVLDEISAIEKEKDELWRIYTESSMSDDDEDKYYADLAIAQKKYSSDKMRKLYKDLITVSINSMGAETFGKLCYLSLEQMFNIILDDKLAIFIPDIYYIVHKKDAEMSALKISFEKIGEENLTTILSIFSTLVYFNDEKGANNAVIYNVLRPDDLKWVLNISAENIKKLAITQADWQEIAAGISNYVDKIPVFNEDIKPFINNEIISYLGDNMHALCLSVAENLENADYNLLPLLSEKIEEDDKVEKFKQKIALIKFTSNDTQVFDDILSGFFALTENKLTNMNITVPENYYQGIENKTLEEKNQSLNTVLEIDLENINNQTLAEYENIFNAFENAAAGYYKQENARTYYYFKNTLGITLL